MSNVVTGALKITLRQRNSYCTKQIGTISVVSLLAKNHKIACENSNEGSASGLAVEFTMKHLVDLAVRG